MTGLTGLTGLNRIHQASSHRMQREQGQMYRVERKGYQACMVSTKHHGAHQAFMYGGVLAITWSSSAPFIISRASAALYLNGGGAWNRRAVGLQAGQSAFDTKHSHSTVTAQSQHSHTASGIPFRLQAGQAAFGTRDTELVTQHSTATSQSKYSHSHSTVTVTVTTKQSWSQHWITRPMATTHGNHP